VNISRSRKGFVPTDVLSTTASTSFTSSSGAVGGKVTNIDSQSAANIVRFSGKICFLFRLYCILSIDAAYCDSVTRSMVCLPVCLSVCVLVARLCPAKTAEPIEMPFGGSNSVGLRNGY